MHDEASARPIDPDAGTPTPTAPLAEATLHVLGLDCRHCVDRIVRALQRVDGAEAAAMDYDSRLATVTYDPTRTDPRAFLGAIVLEGADRGQTFDADLLAIRRLDPDDLYRS